MTLRIGDTHICLSPAPPGGNLAPEENARRLDVYHLSFLVPDLDAAIAECKRRGANFVIENLMANPKRKVAFFEGPDGMRVELMEDL